MIRLSLIIATYNRAVPLLTALQSVVEQSAPPLTWECVVVNNNSQDDTVARFAAFAAQHPTCQLRLVTETNQGLSYARNRGITESVGAYIAIIDDDERINPEFIASYIAFFDAHPAVASAGGRIIPSYPGGCPDWMSKYTEKPIANPIDWGTNVRDFPAGHIPGGGNMALRRTVVEKHGAFNPLLGRVGTKLIGGEESDLFERLSKLGERCGYVPTAIMWHIIPPEKLTTDYFDRLCFNIGVSQLTRAALNHHHIRLVFLEWLKWFATAALCVVYLLRLQPQKSAYLLRMRMKISQGILSALTAKDL
ncbi:MAG: glycosyltransferase [Alistipes sp.]